MSPALALRLHERHGLHRVAWQTEGDTPCLQSLAKLHTGHSGLQYPLRFQAPKLRFFEARSAQRQPCTPWFVNVCEEQLPVILRLLRAFGPSKWCALGLHASCAGTALRSTMHLGSNEKSVENGQLLGCRSAIAAPGTA